MPKNIECEIRAEVRSKDFDKVLKDLKKQGKFAGKTERLSVMFFKCDKMGDYDLRVRITNGDCEVVMKRGDHHAADRVETTQEIARDQFVGLARVFRQFEWDSAKVGERTTYNFDFGDEVLVSLVRGGDICYLEIEKMTEPKNLKKTETKLEAIATELGVDLIRTRSEYYKLCQRFTDETDWQLEDKDGSYQKLAEQLKTHS
ncbi:MAG: CYTH domain-containing protein [Candidatus Uhrbacteria bacterium]|nr:CYTH domain-containing protein [Patescibacteria group bacterium]